ncbi:Wzt carbohydrate-binding domain-containing protein [Azorhizobium doebereinerae]|uniref:Wzt carbohydrate-binding domain-containing protein n=1 Tax=Azorhizobium doebereinerae TaxID=281091 RepID=UPI00040ACE26|nr:Wzt carbohydrate-binding domain-containing protein [Azorhizobium doebereinerae]
MPQPIRAFDGRVIFDHLPKTAGQAVNRWFSDTLGSGCVSTNLVGDHHALIRTYGGMYSVISAHIEFNDTPLDPRYRYITCLREPVDRAVSWLYYVFENKDTVNPRLWQSVSRFLESDGADYDLYMNPIIRDTYVCHFTGIYNPQLTGEQDRIDYALQALDAYDVVGFYEDLDGFLGDISAAFRIGDGRPLAVVNKTGHRPGAQDISPALRARIEALNALDLDFYRRARERHLGHRPALAPQPPPWARYETPPAKQIRSVADLSLLAFTTDAEAAMARGEAIQFELEFSLARPCGELIVGFTLTDPDGRAAFGTDTRLLKRPLLELEAGCFHVGFTCVLDLPDGAYALNIAVDECRDGVDFAMARCEGLCTFDVARLARTPQWIGTSFLPTDFTFSFLRPSVISPIADAAGGIEIGPMPGAVLVGETIEVPFRLVNRSAQIWAGTLLNPVLICGRWLDQPDGGEGGGPVLWQSPLVGEVRPGERLDLHMALPAPATPGRHALMLTLVQKDGPAFEHRGFVPGVADIEVHSADHWAYAGSDARRAYSLVGARHGPALASTGIEGVLMYGPYLPLPAGRYRLRLEGSGPRARGHATLDIVHRAGAAGLATADFSDTVPGETGALAEIVLGLDEDVEDLEIRVLVSAEAEVAIHRVTLAPEPADAAAPGEVPAAPWRSAAGGG